MNQFKILIGADITELQNKVQEHINSGWSLHGYVEQSITGFFFQAVII